MRAPLALAVVAATTLVVGGCYDPHPSPGAPCSDTEPCPSEQTCIAGTCRLAGGSSSDGGTDGPAADQDRDGIADDVDNCPNIANADQANEDGDKLGDACDPCPIVAADPPVDGDGDGVSDSCDPRPAMTGDSIVAFSGFVGGVLPAGWMPAGTVQPTAGGDVGLVANSAVSSSALILAPDAAFVNGAITARVTLDTAVKVGMDSDAALVVALVNPDTRDNIECGLYWGDVTKSSTKILDLYDSLANNGQGSDLKTMSYAFELGTAYTITLVRQGNMYTCSATPVGGATVSISASTNAAPAGALPSILHFGGTAHVASMLVVHSN